MMRLSGVVLLCCASSAAQAGVSIVWELSGAQNLPKTISLACEGQRMRLEPAGTGRTPLLLWDGEAKVLTMADPMTRTYRRATEAELKAMIAQVRALFSGPEGAKRRAMMEKQLSTMPPDQRAQVEAMLAQDPGKAPKEPPKWVFKATGKSGSFGGYDCERYTAKRGTQTMNLCAVPWARAPAQREDFNCFGAMNELSKSMGTQTLESAQADFSVYPGLPVMSVMELGGHKVLTTLRSLENEKLPASLFELPAGYTEQASPGRP